MLVIDEGCWPRALAEIRGLYVETLTLVDLILDTQWNEAKEEQRAWQQLFELRGLAAEPLVANGPGPLARSAVIEAGLTVATCATAFALENMLCPDPALRPGLPQGAWKRAQELSQEANRAHGARVPE